MRSLRMLGLIITAVFALPAHGQSVALRDLLLAEGSVRTRLVGYGLVTGLSGTGDRVTGNFGSRQTVQSIVNLLRRFDVEVPAELLRTRNVAAVLVTADVSAYLRRGGRFDVTVSSIGDAQSLTGGVLWMTPLVADAGGAPQASAQGPLLLTGSHTNRLAFRGATSGRIPDGGVVEADLERPQAPTTNQLLLREPNIETATRVAAVVDSAFGAKGTAKIMDPGSIVFAPADTSGGFAAALARVQALRIEPAVRAVLVVDARDGTIVAGADLRVGPAVVSHDGITVLIERTGDSASVGSAVRAPAGSLVSDVARTLRASRATAAQTAAIFTALRDAGAIAAEVIVR